MTAETADTIAMMRRQTVSFALLVAIAACGGSEVAETQITSSPSSTTTTTTTAEPQEPAPDNRPVYQGLSSETLPDGLTLVAMMQSETDVYEIPGGEEPSRTVPATTILGTPTVLTILEGPDTGWAKVMLPGRPNGSEGWIRTDEALIYVVPGHIRVDLSERRLTYYENGKEILATAVAIGTATNSTPTGEYFVTDNVTLADPNSVWGPHAFGLSARSETITEYNGGDGIIGIHGTSNQWSIGSAASLGCVRVPNDVITELHEMIPIGTPVVINA